MTDWLLNYIAALRKLTLTRDDAHRPFDELGLDSKDLAVMTDELGRAFGIEVDPLMPYEYVTVADLTGYLQGACTQEASK